MDGANTPRGREDNMPEIQTQSPTNAGNTPPAGALDNIQVPAPTTQPDATPNANGNATPAAGAATGQPAGTPADQTPAEPGAEPAQPQRLYAGRYQTMEQLESAYAESGDEGRRLYRELQTVSKDLKGRDAIIEELRAKLAGAPNAFRILGEDEEKTLAEENQGKYTKYLLDKRDHLANEAKAKEDRENARKAKDAEQARVVDAIRKQTTHMRGDSQKYPGFVQLEGVMQTILDVAPEVAGYEWTPNVLYYAAKGLQAIQAERGALEQAAGSQAQAAGQAAATASQAGTTGHPGAKSAPAGDVDPINNEIMNGYKTSVLPSF